MSASAVKSSMPGVGTSPTSTTHTMLPMNAMAQKVVPGTESGSIKPMTGSGISYVTLQPASQPLSLVQDHRPSVYQTPPYVTNSSEKESESDKLIPNGVEVAKSEPEQDVTTSLKQSDTNRNNNLSPNDSPQEERQDGQAEQELTSISLDFPASCTQAPNKTEEKKTPVNNGSKETEGVPVGATVQTKVSSHKTEDSQSKVETQKSKPQPQSIKQTGESAVAPPVTTPPKVEAKIASSPKASKRKSRESKDPKGTSSADGASKPKRNRIQTQPYQSPLPEIALIVKSLNKSPASKAPDDKLIVFYKNEFLAVRNAEGSFYVCQAMQKIYKSSRRIRIRWLSQDKNNGEIYSPDFYDFIDFDCILTNLNLNKIDKNKFQLTKIELLRTENILKRAIDVEAGVSEKPRVTEEHPDGLDLSLYKDESQLKRRKAHGHKQKQGQRKKSKQAGGGSSDEDASDDESGKKSPKSSRPKKRPVNKALAIAKSVAKGSSRAERALNRSTKSDTSSNNNSIAVAAGSTTTTTTTTTTTATTTTTTPAATAAITAVTVVDGAKAASQAKKTDVKKGVAKQPSNNSTTGVPRTKLRGSAQSAQQQGSSAAAGRPKRVTATTGILSSDEAAAPRKKPRGRA